MVLKNKSRSKEKSLNPVLHVTDSLKVYNRRVQRKNIGLFGNRYNLVHIGTNFFNGGLEIRKSAVNGRRSHIGAIGNQQRYR